jgi:uncharacterized protein involved in type VI secretion and phage assembly
VEVVDDLFRTLLDTDDRSGGYQKIEGITTGVVKENWEAKHPGMVRVEVFLGEEGKTLTDWIRVVGPYAGNGYGAYWLPEVGDEVAIAFNMGDVNRPYVIGSLWNNKDKIPDKTATEKNHVKRIRTKGGHEIVFEEEKDKERIEIHTPRNLKMTLEDEKQLISIQDEAGEHILQIDSKNKTITIKAKERIKLDAGGKAVLELDGKGDKAKLSAGSVEIEAKQSLKLKGQNFHGEGNSVDLKGNSGFKVECSSTLVLKGSLTQIN